MLTVKKFGTVLDLSVGGYVSAFLGIIFAVLTILVFPPDIDLAGKLKKMSKVKISNVIWIFTDDDDQETSDNATSVAEGIQTTIASIVSSTVDSDDEDQPMSEREKNDEINDSK